MRRVFPKQVENSCRNNQPADIADDEHGFLDRDGSDQVAGDCRKKQLIGMLAKTICRAGPYRLDQLGNADRDSQPDPQPSNNFSKHDAPLLSRRMIAGGSDISLSPTGSRE